MNANWNGHADFYQVASTAAVQTIIETWHQCRRPTPSSSIARQVRLRSCTSCAAALAFAPQAYAYG